MIETPRLVLRRLVEDDLDAFAQLYIDQKTTEYLGGVLTREQSTEKLRKVIDGTSASGTGPLVMIEKQSGLFIGRCALVPQHVEDEWPLEIGYILASPYWGRGYATEAAAALRDYGFETLRLLRMISLIPSGHERSAAVATRIGMRRERECEYAGLKHVQLFAIDRGV